MLVAFDFDGTLSDSEMTVLLAERAGVTEEVRAITERAMNGEIGYAESLRSRADLLGGLAEADAAAAFDRVALRPGAPGLLADLRAAGHHVAILTGGFEAGVERALADADVAVDSVVANRLPVAGGALAGTVEGPLVEGTKDDALAGLADDLGVAMADTVAVGDGANDLPMLEVAGLAVGYAPTPAVAGAVEHRVGDMAELRRFLAARDLLAD